MDLSPQVIRRLHTTFLTLFRQGYGLGQGQAWLDRLVTSVPSSTSQNDYGWMASLPKMREWLGPRQIQNLLAQSYTLKNRTFESTVAVKREDIEDDNLGVYDPLVQEFGRQTALHPQDLVIELMQNGHSLTCYDGQYFFDNDHPVNPKNAALGTQINYVSTGCALSAANYRVRRAAMMSFKDESGRPIGVNPNLLVVPPALEGTGKQIVKADRDAAGASNVDQGTADLLVIPELSGADTTWFLFDTNRIIKPFVFQRRRSPAFVQKTAINEDNVFFDNELVFGADCRDNAGFALWFLGSKHVA
jgi:phage major head subunit gpT-like protein